jgi:hypothetical protein
MRAPQDLYVASPENEKRREEKRKHARDGRTPDKEDAMRMRREPERPKRPERVHQKQKNQGR